MIETIRISRTSLTRKLTMTFSALALALAGMTAAAVPARANDDLAKFLLGATAVVIIGTAIANGNRAQAQPDPHPKAHRPHKDRRETWHDHRGGRHDDRGWKTRAPVLPAGCAIAITGHATPYYGARCLERHGPRVALPARCARSMTTHRGERRIYDGQCLANAGFRLDGGRHSRR